MIAVTVTDIFEYQWRGAIAKGDHEGLRRLCLFRARALTVSDPEVADLIVKALGTPGSAADAALTAARARGDVPGDPTTWALLAVHLGRDPIAGPASPIESPAKVVARWSRTLARARRTLADERALTSAGVEVP